MKRRTAWSPHSFPSPAPRSKTGFPFQRLTRGAGPDTDSQPLLEEPKASIRSGGSGTCVLTGRPAVPDLCTPCPKHRSQAIWGPLPHISVYEGLEVVLTWEPPWEVVLFVEAALVVSRGHWVGVQLVRLVSGLEQLGLAKTRLWPREHWAPT